MADVTSMKARTLAVRPRATRTDAPSASPQGRSRSSTATVRATAPTLPSTPATNAAAR